MAADKNKVEFGLKSLYFGTYSIDPDTQEVQLGQPYWQKGAVSLSVDAESDSNNFYADDSVFWSGFTDNGLSGSIEVAKFDSDFKAQFKGYKKTKDGGLAQVKNAITPDTYLMFETTGNVEPRRVIIYNVALGAISREYSTIEDNKEPVTESIDFTATGDNATGITQVSYSPGDAGYADLFTNPPKPELAE